VEAIGRRSSFPPPPVTRLRPVGDSCTTTSDPGQVGEAQGWSWSTHGSVTSAARGTIPKIVLTAVHDSATVITAS
jgi:hypothetical protein